MLHAVPYKETSLVVELFCRDHGRLPVVAKGAKRPHSALRSVLLNFQPIAVRFSGKSEVKTLTQAEWCGALMPPEGKGLFAGYYLNELLMHGLGREDPHPELFDHYTQALAGLSEGEDMTLCVRKFEIALLSALGYGIDFSKDSEGAAINAEFDYCWLPERGWIDARSVGDHMHRLSGLHIIELEAGLLSRESALTLKPLTRSLLANHVSSKGLLSRAWMEQLVKYD
jgi:DNA repair protein RecO (recombination protein O)